MFPLSFAFLLLSGLSQAARQPSEQPLAVVTGKGVQIYTCKADGGWAFVAPEAKLYQGGVEVGSHSAGPRWTWKDGSTVTGKLVKSTPAPDAKDIPWLELNAAPDSANPGFLTAAGRVSRTATEGGAAPTLGCDAAHRGHTARVPYTATYTFWSR